MIQDTINWLTTFQRKLEPDSRFPEYERIVTFQDLGFRFYPNTSIQDKNVMTLKFKVAFHKKDFDNPEGWGDEVTDARFIVNSGVELRVVNSTPLDVDGKYVVDENGEFDLDSPRAVIGEFDAMMYAVTQGGANAFELIMQGISAVELRIQTT